MQKRVSRSYFHINNNLLKSKRSQVTILIILAVVVIVGILIFSFLNKESSSLNLENAFSKIGATSQATIIESQILECIKSISEDANVVIGIQGGYYNAPPKFEDIGLAFIPYYYDQSTLQPSKEKIESELALYLDENIDFCLNQINNNELSLSYKTSDSSAKINQDSISFTTDLSITISKEELTETIKLENHPIEINSPLNDAFEIATFITQTHKEDPENICISCITQMASDRDMFVDFLESEEEATTLVVISKSYENQDPYIFQFLNKYQ